MGSAWPSKGPNFGLPVQRSPAAHQRPRSRSPPKPMSTFWRPDPSPPTLDLSVATDNERGRKLAILLFMDSMYWTTMRSNNDEPDMASTKECCVTLNDPPPLYSPASCS